MGGERLIVGMEAVGSELGEPRLYVEHLLDNSSIVKCECKQGGNKGPYAHWPGRDAEW